MRVIRGYDAIPSDYQNAAIAIGNFDGVHRGHQALISHVKTIAREADVPAGIMSFEPHPRQFFAAQKGRSFPTRLIPLHEKLRLLREMGLDVVYLMRFTPGFAALSADAFIEKVLVQSLKISHVVTGQHFIFGANRSGNAETLKAAAEKERFTYDPMVEIPLEERDPSDPHPVISSTRIRKALAEGDIQTAAQLLGRPYRMSGVVVHGDQRGRTIGFPTANISIPLLHCPRFGVYAVRFREYRNQNAPWMPAVANIGLRPTVAHGALTPRLEVHAFDVERDLYGARLEVEYVGAIREEKRFDGLDALKAQIALDCTAAWNMLNG